jgi:hypothetical protein
MPDGPTGLVSVSYFDPSPRSPQPVTIHSESSGAPVPAPHPTPASSPGLGYLTPQRTAALVLGTLSAAGGVAGIFGLTAIDPPAGIADALLTSLKGITAAAGLAGGVSSVVVAGVANPNQLHEQVQEAGEAIKWAQPYNLAAKLADKTLGTQGKIEEAYEMFKAATDLSKQVGKEAAEMIQSLSEKVEAMDTIVETALKESDDKKQQSQSRGSQSLGSENNFDSSH